LPNFRTSTPLSTQKLFYTNGHFLLQSFRTSTPLSAQSFFCANRNFLCKVSAFLYFFTRKKLSAEFLSSFAKFPLSCTSSRAKNSLPKFQLTFAEFRGIRA
jgi:hypothetical protein